MPEVNLERRQDGLLDVNRPFGLISLDVELLDHALLIVHLERLGQMFRVLHAGPVVEFMVIQSVAVPKIANSLESDVQKKRNRKKGIRSGDLLVDLVNFDIIELDDEMVGTCLDDDLVVEAKPRVLPLYSWDTGTYASVVQVRVLLTGYERISGDVSRCENDK